LQRIGLGLVRLGEGMMPGGHMIDALQANFANYSDFNYSIHIDPDRRFIYFNNPKCACTTIKASLNLSFARSHGKQLRYNDLGEIHDRGRNFMLAPHQIGIPDFERLLKNEEVLRFSFIREPVSRLVSAYENKVRWLSPSRRLLARRTGHDDDWVPTFEEFAACLMESSGLRDCDEHWRLQVKQTCSNIVSHHFTGIFDQVESDLDHVLSRLFQTDAVIFDVRKHFRGNQSASNQRLDTLHPDLRARLADAYREDVVAYRNATAARTGYSAGQHTFTSAR
jgi:hypothetical protein